MTTLPPYTPTDWELRLPGYPIIGNRWRSSSFPEALGSLPSEAEWRLTYENRTSDEALALLLPWRATGGGQWPLTQLPQETAYGVDDIEFLKRLTGTIWTIAREPQKQSVKNGRFNVTIELVYELTLEISYVDVFQDGAATGFARSVTASFAAGAAQGGGAGSAAAGFALSVAASFVGGAAAAERDGEVEGFELDISASFAAGTARGEEGVTATGSALSVDVSFAGGAAAGEINGVAEGCDLSIDVSLAAGAAAGEANGEAEGFALSVDVSFAAGVALGGGSGPPGTVDGASFWADWAFVSGDIFLYEETEEAASESLAHWSDWQPWAEPPLLFE